MTINALQPIYPNLPIGSLEAYLHYVNQIPLLTLEEEQAFARALQQNNELAAAQRLILSHLRYVARVAKGYMGYGLPLADLIQEGNVGLMKAVKRFNPDMGVRLVTFAMHWIKAEIHEYIIRNWRLVKIATTKAQRKLFFNLRNLKKRLGWMTNEEVEAVATDLGVKPETVREMEMRLSQSDLSIDAPSDDEQDASAHHFPAALLVDSRATPADDVEGMEWEEHADKTVHYALSTLDARSQDIIQARWLAEKKPTLQDLADKYSISAERVRQLEKNALQKLKSAIEVHSD